jgi:hypothetical protein
MLSVVGSGEVDWDDNESSYESDGEVEEVVVKQQTALGHAKSLLQLRTEISGIKEDAYVRVLLGTGTVCAEMCTYFSPLLFFAPCCATVSDLMTALRATILESAPR